MYINARLDADIKVFPPTRIICTNKMGPFITLRNLPLAVLSVYTGVLATSVVDLPTVDLEYTKHRALSYNVSTACLEIHSLQLTHRRKRRIPTA